MVLFAGAAWAQTSASHEITVRIPNILRLRIGDGPGSSRAETAVTISVSQDAYVITPSGTEVQVLANSAWQLSARYSPASRRDAAAHLLWQLAGGDWQAFAAYDQLVTQGRATGGWQRLELTYGLAEPLPPEGDYQGIITYTLTRP